jgi:hypothetical protein
LTVKQVHINLACMEDFEEGFLIGILVGEGHFGGDGLQPQVTVRMHVRHEDLFQWLVAKVPGSKLYGPYHHGGRHYFQWMARGQSLREGLLPILRRHAARMDSHVRGRFEQMIERYGLPEVPKSTEHDPAQQD